MTQSQLLHSSEAASDERGYPECSDLAPEEPTALHGAHPQAPPDTPALTALDGTWHAVSPGTPSPQTIGREGQDRQTDVCGAGLQAAIGSLPLLSCPLNCWNLVVSTAGKTRAFQRVQRLPWLVLGSYCPTLDHNAESFPVPRAPCCDYKVIQAMLSKQQPKQRCSIAFCDTSTPSGQGGSQPHLCKRWGMAVPCEEVQGCPLLCSLSGLIITQTAGVVRPGL